ncbi:RDD family protein [Ureibacillus sp. MALMAid1270]|uniref:RDD family protein n=1 Tax=Ureibacillus sp. MALMAid1270 TaxID=3411629 RepID=UPI003BA634F3
MTIEDSNGFNHSSNESEIVTKPVNYQNVVEYEFEQKTVGFWLRFFAFIIDQAIVSALLGIVIYPLFKVANWSITDTDYLAPITIVSAIFYYGYFILMTKYFGQTLGKMIFGIKVQTINGEKLNWSTVIFRELIGRFINNTISILYLLVIFMPKNNSLADYFADTVVIQENVYIKKKKEAGQSVQINSHNQISPSL